MDEKRLKALATELAKGLKTEADLNAFSRMLTKLTVETALNAELTDHPGHEKNAPKKGSNTRNGYSSKTLLCDDDEIELSTPRDRENTFESQLIKKNVINKAVFLALGINTEGQKELPGMWLAENEGAKFWLSVLTELKNRGLQDILIACVDGLKGFPDAINSVDPQTHIQLCIIHMVRNSLKYVSWKDYKAVTSGLKAVYRFFHHFSVIISFFSSPAIFSGCIVRRRNRR